MLSSLQWLRLSNDFEIKFKDTNVQGLLVYKQINYMNQTSTTYEQVTNGEYGEMYWEHHASLSRYVLY